MKKFLTVLFAFLAVVLFASWQYRLLCLLLVVVVNREWVKQRVQRKGYKILVWGLAISIFLAMPNYFQRGRTQLHYLTEQGKQRPAPLPAYLANVVMPEKEACNLGVKATALLPSTQKGMLGLGGYFFKEAHDDFWKGKMLGFYSMYNKWSHPGSFVYGQVWNQLTDSDYDAIYIIRPKRYSKDQAYPVVFFCHGYLGSWELYQGIFDRLDNCIVVSIGTRDLSGIFGHKDIQRIFDKYIPYLEHKGYHVDRDQLHLMGLSNGGSAADVALRSFSSQFKTITYISTPCNVIKHSRAKVLMAVGGRDREALGLPSSKRRLEACGTRCAMLYYPEENHYMMVRKAKDVTDFLNAEMGL